MKTVAMIPYWAGYAFPENTLAQRDTIRLGGRALINYTVRIANHVEAIDEVVIYASSPGILDQLDSQATCGFLQRDTSLDAQGVSIESIIDGFLAASDADIIVLMHPKSPFLKPATVAACIEKVRSGFNDSAFVVTRAQKFAWFGGRPLNYSGEGDTPSLSSIEPVVLESSSVYVFSRALFTQTHRRIGSTPHMQEVGHFEGFEVDRSDDFEIAELIVNAGLEMDGA